MLATFDVSMTSLRRQWHPTPVFLPGKSRGQGSLVGCHLWGLTELDMTDATQQQQQQQQQQLGFIFLGSKITANGDCSHEIKRRLLLGRKVLTNLDSILESRNIRDQQRSIQSKLLVFPVVMYGCETIWMLDHKEG